MGQLTLGARVAVGADPPRVRRWLRHRARDGASAVSAQDTCGALASAGPMLIGIAQSEQRRVRPEALLPVPGKEAG
jgi:hypothetical protein